MPREMEGYLLVEITDRMLQVRQRRQSGQLERECIKRREDSRTILDVLVMEATRNGFPEGQIF